ncbi:Uncharacterised protein [uncultured archaeon]|nr:Uncharacterised protein [uncultured archaeon]
MGVIAEYLVNGAAPSTVGGTGTGAKYFSDLPGRPGWASSNSGVNAAADSLQQGAVPSATSAVGQLRVPGANRLNAQKFYVTAAGTYGSDSGDPSGTVNIELVANTNTEAAPTYVVIASLGAAAPKFANAEGWLLDAVLFGDSASGLVSGYYTGMVGGAFLNQAGTAASVILQNTIAGINFAPTAVNSYPFGLLVRATFGTSDATNTASLFQFQISAE